MTRHPLLPLFVALLLTVTSASAETPKEAVPTPNVDPAGGRKAIPLSGKVTEILASGGYTYVSLATADGPVWAAFPAMPVTVGQHLTLVPGYEMKNFTSKTLNRTFDRLVFTAGPSEKQAHDPNLVREAHKGRDTAVQPAPPAPPRAAPSEAAALVPPHAAPPPRLTSVKVAKATGKNAYTVKELYARRSALDNKRVAVRGKVVKVNPRILKQCWIHLQDGTGKPGKVDAVLVTTTPTTNMKIPKVGDEVTATGTLHKDRDYGGGYRYAVILDNTEYRIERTGK